MDALRANLEMYDLMDLVQTAIVFYDMLTPDWFVAERTKLDWPHSGRTRGEWHRVIRLRREILNTHYNDSVFRDAEVAPQTLRQFLVKFSWLSFEDPQSVNWQTFNRWIAALAADS